jgi:hypothetical protein
LPVPRVEDGKWSKERERTKSGRWRRKRSDANKPRKRSSNALKYALAFVGIAVVAFVVVVLFFPEWFGLPRILPKMLCEFYVEKRFEVFGYLVSRVI